MAPTAISTRLTIMISDNVHCSILTGESCPFIYHIIYLAVLHVFIVVKCTSNFPTTEPQPQTTQTRWGPSALPPSSSQLIPAHHLYPRLNHLTKTPVHPASSQDLVQPKREAQPPHFLSFQPQGHEGSVLGSSVACDMHNTGKPQDLIVRGQAHGWVRFPPGRR